MWLRHPYIWLTAALAVVLVVRALGPSDVYPDPQQNEAMHRAADVVLNGRLVLPRDAVGDLPLRPPLLPVLAAVMPGLGFWGTWAFKLPVALAGVAMVVATLVMARRLAGRLARQMRRSFDERGAHWTNSQLLLVAGLAALAVVANPAFIRYVYQVRVEMLAAAVLTVAWVAGTAALSPGTRRRRLAAGLFWASVGLAGLTQGWIAALPLVYVVAAARLIQGRWSALHRLQWRWGAPLAAGLFALWAIPAGVLDAGHLLTAMAPRGVSDRLDISDGGWLLWRVPQRLVSWLVERYFPWSIAAIVTLVWMGPRRWLRSPLGPAVLWLLVLVAVYLPLPGKGAGDLLATLPPMAILAVLFFVMDQPRWSVPPWLVGAVAAGMIVLVCSREVTFSSTAWEGEGVAVSRFARHARQVVGTDPVSFGPAVLQTPVAPLMGRHPLTLRTEGAAAAAWRVRFASEPGPQARAVSTPLTTPSGDVSRLVLSPVAVDGP